MSPVHQPSIGGAAVLVSGLALLTFGFLEMPELGYMHWIVVTSLLLGFALLIAFLIIENKIAQPMVPLGLFKNKTFSGVNLLSFFLYAGLGAIMLFLSLNLIQIQGYSQLQAGLTFMPFSLTMVLLARKMGALSDKLGVRRFLIVGPAITGIGMIWLSQIGMTAGPSAYWTTYFPAFLVFAVGMSITVVPLTTAVMTCVDGGKSGIASGINNSVTRIAGTFINAILGAAATYLFADFVMLEVNLITTSEVMKREIIQETIKLGQAKASENYSPELQSSINTIFDEGFITVYRWVGQLSAELAFLSSIIAFFMVEEKKIGHV